MSNENSVKQTSMQGKNGAAKTNGGNRHPSILSKNGIDLNIDAIDEMASGASPRQLKNWITHLEALYDTRRLENRKELKSEVDRMLLSNDYSVEELYAARPIPTLDDLAAQVNARKKNKVSKRDQMIKNMLG